MKAVRLHPASPPSEPYSPSNPAPPSALQLDTDIPIPELSNPDEILVRIKAASVIRDALTWPETYQTEYITPGNDFAGIVEKVHPDHTHRWKVGDKVYGMTPPDRPCTWAEYAVMKESEVELKPWHMTLEAVAALPLSAMTAVEAMYEHSGLIPEHYWDSDHPNYDPPQTLFSGVAPRALVTGATGGVGMYLVQLLDRAGYYFIAATSSRSRNEEFLEDLGATLILEYTQFNQIRNKFDLIIDTVGGDVLASCWSLIDEHGTLISVDSSSHNFVEEHRERGLSAGKEGVNALFFILSGNRRVRRLVAEKVAWRELASCVADTFPLEMAAQAYERACSNSGDYGKIILTVCDHPS